MADVGMDTSTIFSSIIGDFDKNVLTTINTGSTQLISLISPLMAVCFSIYVLLILWSYWRGDNDQPIDDFLRRMAVWAFILTCGMNIQFYSDYIVPFFNGLGEQIAGALTGGTNPVSGLDNMLSAYINACERIYQGASGFQTISAVWLISIIIIFGTPFMAVAVVYIILSKFALGLLLALGPMFISAALFPPTRRYFENWAGQCMNYVLLISLFAAACAVEVSFAVSMVPSTSTPTIKQVIELEIMGIVFWMVSLNLPGLASQLAGGVGISSMVGKLKPFLPKGSSKPPSDPPTGGSISGK
jgi:type IV secretion system protein VirB6